MPKQAAQRAGACHAVPLVAQAASGQRERVARFTLLGHRHVDRIGEPRLAIGCWKTAVLVEPIQPVPLAFRERPLLGRQLKGCVTEPRNVEVAPAGGLAMFVPDLLRARRRERGARRTPWATGVPAAAPVPPRSTSRAARPPARARRRARVRCGGSLLVTVPSFSPQVVAGSSRSAQSQGGGGGKTPPAPPRIRRAPGRAARWLGSGMDWAGFGAGDPQRLDLAVGSGLEHFHSGLAGFFPAPRGTPQKRRHLGAVPRVGQVAVCADSRLAKPPTSRPP